MHSKCYILSNAKSFFTDRFNEERVQKMFLVTVLSFLHYSWNRDF